MAHKTQNIDLESLRSSLGRRWGREDSMRLLRRSIPDINYLDAEAMVDAVTLLDEGGALEREICGELTDLVGPNYSPHLILRVREELCRLLQRQVRDAFGLPCLERRRCRDGDEKQECSVCLNALHHHHHQQEGEEEEEEDEEEEGMIATLNCRHEYHVHCITRWLLRGGNVCPLCRGKALLLQTDNLDNLLLALF